jgi:hypothetical protein
VPAHGIALRSQTLASALSKKARASGAPTVGAEVTFGTKAHILSWPSATCQRHGVKLRRVGGGLNRIEGNWKRLMERSRRNGAISQMMIWTRSLGAQINSKVQRR